MTGGDGNELPEAEKWEGLGGMMGTVGSDPPPDLSIRVSCEEKEELLPKELSLP